MGVKGLRNTKLFAIILVLVMLAGIFSLSPAISSLMKGVVIRSTGEISTAYVTARSGSPEDIQAAVDAVAAEGGGVAYVPAGNFTFNVTGSSGVDVPGGVNVIGAGKDITILTQPQDPPQRSTMFYVHGENGKRVRISGITFDGYVSSEDYGTSGILLETVKDFRIDHCSFEDFTSRAVGAGNGFKGINRGVIDHCDFDNPYKDIIGGAWGYGIIVWGDGETWEPDINNLLGHYDDVNNVVYIEDCNFSRCRYGVAGNGLGFYVVRYSTVTECRPTHWAGFDVHAAPGGRGIEAYNNTIIGPEYVGGGYAAQGFKIRGGGGVIYNNTITNCSRGIWLIKEGEDEQKWVHDLWIWSNTKNMGTMVVNDGGYVENQDYFLTQKSEYTPYPYPHPLALEVYP